MEQIYSARRRTIKISNPEELGAAIRATRVAINIPVADLAEMLGTSRTLLRRREQGKATTALKILFATLHELGIDMTLDIPLAAEAAISGPNAKKLSKKRARP